MVATVVPVSVVVIVVVISVIVVAIPSGRVGLVEVMSSIEAAVSMDVATLEGYEHCGTVEEHPSDTIAAVDEECHNNVDSEDGTVEPSSIHDVLEYNIAKLVIYKTKKLRPDTGCCIIISSPSPYIE